MTTVLEPEERHPEQPEPNIAAIAVIGFIAGLVLWLGGACIILGGNQEASTRQLPAGSISTPQAPRPTATVLGDRTNCAEIRGTEYRSEAERQWYRQNCS